MEKSEFLILVPTDFSEQSECALQKAIQLAELVNGKIELLFVLHEKKGILGSLFNNEQSKVFDQMVETKLEEMAQKYRSTSNIVLTTVLKHHTSVHTQIVEYAQQINASLIVMGKGSLTLDGKSVDGIGSNTSRVLRNTTIPLITISNGNMSQGVRSIILPLDLTKETRQKVSWAIKFAKLFNSSIYVISGLWDQDDKYVVSQLNLQMNQVVKFIQQHNITVESQILTPKDGSKGLIPIVRSFIADHADIDLAIIMTQQENNFTEFFVGSAATSFIREVQIPVLSIIPRQIDNIVIGY